MPGNAETIADLTHALRLSEELGDDETAAELRLELSRLYLESNQPRAAIDCLTAGIAAARGTGGLPLEAAYHLNLGVAYHALDRAPDARESLEDALALALEAGVPALEGSVRGQLGMLLRENGDAPAAVEQLRRARDLCRAAGDEPSLCRALYHLAQSYRDLEQWEPALEAAHQALDLCAQGEQAALHGAALALLGHLYGQRTAGDKPGNLETAIRFYEQALGLLARDADEDEWATVQHNLGLAYLNRLRGRAGENVPAAIRALEAALEVYTAETHPDHWALTQYNLAVAWRQRQDGDPGENVERSIACCRAVVQACDPTAHLRAWVQAQVGLAEGYRQRLRGDHAENLELGIAALEQVLGRLDAAAEPELRAEAENALGNCYYDRLRGTRSENLELALAHFGAALQVRSPREMAGEWATTQNNLGNVYRQRIQGDRAENLHHAVEAFQAALTACTRQADPRKWAMIQNNLGAALLDLAQEAGPDREENLERAIACFQDSLAERPPELLPREWCTTQGNLGAAYLLRRRGDPGHNRTRAIAALEQSTGLARRLGLDAHLADSAVNLARVRLAREEWAEAHQALSEASAALERLESRQATDVARRAYLRQLAPLYADDAFCLAVLGQAGEALERLDAGRSRFLAETMAREEARLAALRPEDRRAFTDLRDRIKALEDEQAAPNPRAWAGLAAAVREARQQFQALLDRIHSEVPDFLPAGLRAHEIQALLEDEETALLTWAITDWGTATLIATRAGGVEAIVRRDWTADDLLHLLIEGIDEQRRPAGGWMGGYDRYQIAAATGLGLLDSELEAWFAPLSGLWEPLLAAAHERLQALDIRRLILIPSRGLHMLPLHAAGQPCLLDHYVVTYVPSATVLGRCRQRLREPERRAARGALIVCHTGGNLEFALAEAHHLAALLARAGQPVQVLAEEQARQDRVESLAAGCHLLHLACHGRYNWAEPLASSLWLAGPDGEAAPYELWEIQAGLHLQALSLVTLSACETGLSEAFELPEECVGLPAALLAAGAPALVSTLWTVNDLSTMLLMERFYAGYLDGKPPPVALREAQGWLRNVTAGELAERFAAERHKPDAERAMSYPQASATWRRWVCLSRDERPFAHPVYWAAFIFTGA